MLSKRRRIYIEIAPMRIRANPAHQRVWGYLVTGNYFDLLGVKPAIGRFFRADEDVTPGAAPYAVLSHAAWRSSLTAIPPIAGRVINLNGRPFTVLGVAPEGFRGTELFYVPEIWVPMMMQAHIEGNSWLENRNTNNTCVLARIKSGVNKEQAEENLNAVGTVLGRELGWNRETTKTRNHEDTKPQRHETTKTRRYEGTTTRRRDGTKTRRHCDAATKTRSRVRADGSAMSA